MRPTLAILALALSCARPGVASVASGCPRGGTAATPDSARGILQIVGSEPGVSANLNLPDGRFLDLGHDVRHLRPLQGLEVVVFGRRGSGRVMQVASAIVRATQGRATEDGVLVREPAGDFLVTCDGRRLRIAHLPEALRGAAGARVWIERPVSDASTFGLVQP